MQEGSTPFIHSTPIKPHLLFATTATLGLLFMSRTAAAATEDPQTADNDATAARKVKQLDGVKVEGQALTPASPKFTAPLLDTPRSVSVIPSEMLQATNATTLAQALQMVPGITFGAGEGGSPINDIPYIRGFDSSADIFIDGVRDIGAQTREAFDIDQIDVIKGASSIYTGRGAAGGSVNITTKSPELKNFTNFSTGLGSDSYKRGTFDGNYVLGQHTAARIDLLAQDANTPGRHDVGGKRYGIAPSIGFGLDTANRLTIKYYHLYTTETPDSGIPYNYSTGKPINTNTDNFYGLLDRDFRKTHADIGSVHFEHDFNDDWTLLETARYGRTSYNYIWSSPDDGDGNVANGLVYRVPKSRIGSTNSAVNQTDLTGKFDTGSIHHSVDFGIEYEHDITEVQQYSVKEPGGLTSTTCDAQLIAAGICTTVDSPDPHDSWAGSYAPNHNPTRTTSTTKSVYALDTITFSDQWIANIGARYDDYKTRAVGYNTSAKNDSLGAFDLHNKANLWSWQAGLVYKPQANGSIYASWATSSSPSGLANGEGDQHVEASLSSRNNLSPQKIHNVEVGTKWDFFDDRLSLTGALFKASMTNALVQTSSTTYELAGTKKVEGVELGLTGHIGDQWMIYSGYSHLHATLHSGGNYAATDGDGNQFPNTAKDSATLWTYFSPIQTLRLGVGAYAMSHQYGNVANTLGVPGYVRFDAMASYQVNPHLDLQLNFYNLTNKVYYTQAYAIAFAQEGPARAGMITANFHF